MNNSTRVVANSSILYCRLIIITLLKLYATKLLVKYLGLEDFGIYNLLSGIVVMLAFLKATMASASQRFISVSLGKEDVCKTRELFYLLISLHLFFAFIATGFIDIIGCLFVQNVLNIPEGKFGISFVVIHTMAISTGLSIIRVPYDALLISKENILYLSIFLILESLLNIFAIVLLAYCSDSSKLIVYSVESVLIILISSIIVVVYNLRYKETHFKFHKIKDWTYVKEISRYMGWNVISSLFCLIRNQGFSVLFNIVGGVVINSAYGVANQVNSLVSYAIEAMMQPLRPQITKTESSGNRFKSLNIVSFSTKVILALLTLLIIPLVVNMNYILSVWLETVPEYTVSFCNILLFSTFAYAYSLSIKAHIEATGNVKNLFAVIGYMHIFALGIAIILVCYGISVVWAYSIIILEEVAASSYRIYLANSITGLNIIDFVKKIMVPSFLCFISLYGLIEFAHIMLSNFVGLLLSFFFSFIMVPTIYYTCIFNDSEKNTLKQIADSYAKKHYIK